MFYKAIWLFAILCGYVNSVKPNALNGSSFAGIEGKQIIHKEEVLKPVHIIKTRELRTKNLRRERGIVMVDSDFDIPSEIYSYENNLGTGEMFGKEIGSGVDEFDEKESTKAIKDDIQTESEYHKTTSVTRTSTRSSTEVTNSRTTVAALNTRDIVSTDIDGSGDETVQYEEYSTSEMLTETYTTPEHHGQERIPDVCMNSTCTSNDLSIVFSEESFFVPEGTNATLACVSNNSSYNMLYWYKSNGSVYLLQAFNETSELNLNIPDAKPIQSGIYMCVKWVNRQTCCNVQSNITIYEVPLYIYHLMIIGIVAAACLIICMLLSVRQSRALKMYTKQFAVKHGKVTNPLL